MKLSQIKLTNPYLELPKLCYDRVTPSPLKEPYLIHANKNIADILGIDADELQSDAFVEWVNGSLQLHGSEPFAMCYAGHQFGYLVERLGDGRAINIGTIGDMHLQLKGAGKTLYSRGGDGRAVLRSSIREYLMSEAMYGLGIETTRALALIGSQHKVIREDWEKGAIVLRLSPSWVRFGTFEYFMHQQKYEELEALVDYAIAESYGHLAERDDRYLLFFLEVMQRTALLIAQWQSVGFNHGVMNTDNMSIAGLTIDYGPYAFLDDYDFNNVCNHTDRDGRYSFGNQPDAAHWNLQVLAQALSPLVSTERTVKELLAFGKLYQDHYMDIMGQKLGFESNQDEDRILIKHLLGVLQSLQVDYTLFFRTISHYDGDREALLRLGIYHRPMHDWLDAYDKRLEQEESTVTQRQSSMLAINPKYVLKNYMLQEAIDSAKQGDFSLVDALFDIAQDPYSEHSEYERWAAATPEIYRNQKLSCSS